MAVLAEVAVAAGAEVARMAAVDLSRTAGTRFFFNQKARSDFPDGLLVFEVHLVLLHVSLIFANEPQATLLSSGC